MAEESDKKNNVRLFPKQRYGRIMKVQNYILRDYHSEKNLNKHSAEYLSIELSIY